MGRSYILSKTLKTNWSLIKKCFIYLNRTNKNETMKPIKKIVLALTCLSLLVITACQKDKSTPTPTPTPPPTSTCPTGYTGTNCATQITPSQIKINKIIITKFPQFNSGSNWDGCCDIGNSNPDLYIQLSMNSSVLFTTGYIQDASYNQAYEFNSTNSSSILPYLISSTGTFTISAYDKENIVSDVFIGGFNFPSYSNTNHFPSILYIDNGSDIAFQLYVTYIF